MARTETSFNMASLSTAKSVAKKIRLDSDARALCSLLGGVSIGGALAASVALRVLRRHFVAWSELEKIRLEQQLEDSDDEIEAMEQE